MMSRTSQQNEPEQADADVHAPIPPLVVVVAHVAIPIMPGDYRRLDKRFAASEKVVGIAVLERRTTSTGRGRGQSASRWRASFARGAWLGFACRTAWNRKRPTIATLEAILWQRLGRRDGMSGGNGHVLAAPSGGPQ
jgi:hypothetical protein